MGYLWVLMASKPRVLMIMPTARDLRNLDSRKIRDRYRVEFFGEDVDNPGDFDPKDFIRKLDSHVRKTGIPDGLVGDDDYPANLVAGLVAPRFGLRGPSLESLFLCQHKYYSRLAQAQSVPAATPPFFLIPLNGKAPSKKPSISFPFFVKPVKGYLSILSRKVRSAAELKHLVLEGRKKIPYFTRPFDWILKEADLGGTFPRGGANLIGEGLLTGHQVTLEGYVFGGEPRLIDVVDSHFFPGTGSFRRFESPSRLPRAVQEKMFDLASRFLKSIRFDNSLFNVEFLYEPRKKSIHLLEVNSRMASQFAEMTEWIHGTNTYEILLDLSLGQRPKFRRFAGRFKAAGSFVLRRFKDAFVERVPTERELKEISLRTPGVAVEVLVPAGKRLSSHFQQDDESYRYALINVSAADRRGLKRKFEAVREALPFQFSR